ncbi:hypothetical protein ACW5W4_01085 [Aeromonas crassostreae]
MMNKDKKDYIYNPKPFRRPRNVVSPRTPWPEIPPVKIGNAGFIFGLMIGLMVGFILAKLT